MFCERLRLVIVRSNADKIEDPPEDNEKKITKDSGKYTVTTALFPLSGMRTLD
jgi:hypothetical protein